jgi:transcription elongation factor Elf1
MNCPRCNESIPNNATPGAYPGALSRTDNKTEICSECGTQEAFEQMLVGEPIGQEHWPIV